jgi:PKD repeat protein
MSTNGGASWTPINSGLPSKAIVYSLAVNPLNPETLYAGTSGAGIFMSTNGGTSWTAVNSGLTVDSHAYILAIDPADPQTIYAGSQGDGIFVTTNGGVSWTQNNTGLVSTYITSLAIDPANSNIIYAGTLGGVYKSATYTISGTVTAGGAPLAGVTVSLTGAATQSVTSASDGTYSLIGLLNGSYTVTPSYGQYTFTPASSSVTISGQNSTGQDFAGTPPALADFTAAPTSGKTPLAVKFTDKSTGTEKAWLWQFGDGKTGKSQNPSHTYSNAGSYTVKLAVTRKDGTTSSCAKVNCINAYSVPKANFSATPASGKAPLQVNFKDKSTGTITGWLWDFGDAQPSSSVQNPIYTYTSPGTYTVELTVTGPGGISSKNATIKVTK